MMDRLMAFRFRPSTWAHRERIEAPIALTEQMVDDYLRCPAIEPSDFDEFAMRMALLTEEEWLQVGFGVALSPSFGRVTKSLDGNLRQLVKARFSPEQIEALDALEPQGRLLAPHWRDADAVILGGISSAIATLGWDEAIAQYHHYKFATPLPGGVVEGLTIERIGDICQHLLPNSHLFA
jgi:hypothetical protein